MRGLHVNAPLPRLIFIQNKQDKQVYYTYWLVKKLRRNSAGVFYLCHRYDAQQSPVRALSLAGAHIPAVVDAYI